MFFDLTIRTQGHCNETLEKAMNFFVTRILNMSIYTGISTVAMCSAAAVLIPAKDGHGDFASLEGARIGAFAGASTYIVCDMIKLICNKCIGNANLLNDSAAEQVLKAGLIYLYKFSINGTLAAVGAAAFEYGKPAQAAVDQTLGNAMIGAFLLVLIGVMYGCMYLKTRATVNAMVQESNFPQNLPFGLRA